MDKGILPDAIAEMEYKILLEFTPDDTGTRNKLAVILFRKNRLPEAAAEYNRVLAVDPRNFDALDGLGEILAAQQRYPEAIASYSRAIAENDQDVMVYYHLGLALIQTRAFESAQKALLKGLELGVATGGMENAGIIAQFRHALDVVQKALAGYADNDSSDS